MSRNFLLTPQAEADASAIWEYLADTASEAIADRVLARVYDECEKLGGMPGMGHFREDLLDRRHKFWSALSYVIAYRWKVKPIQVIAILHGARDLTALLKRRG